MKPAPTARYSSTMSFADFPVFAFLMARGIGSDVRHAQTIEVLSVNLSDKKIMTSQGRGYERSTYGLERLAPALE